MDKTMPTYTPMRPKPMAELLPGIKGLLTNDTIQILTSKKKTPKIHQTLTNVKSYKPMTIAEIRGTAILQLACSLNDLKANCKDLTVLEPTPRQQPKTAKVKPWNSSVKLDKTRSLTRDGQMKHSTARKGLNFQPKPNPAENNRKTMIAAVTRKSIHPQAKSRDYCLSRDHLTRISGVCKIQETPIINEPKKMLKSILPHKIPTVEINNISFKSTSDDSFILKEKEINDFEEKCNALTEEPTLEKIAEISPPVSTPFKDYRNVKDYFNQSEADNSVLWKDNTIMSFDKPSENNDTKREESSIVSLCEMLHKATVTNTNNNNQELSNLEEVARETENNLKMIDNVLELLNSMKEKQLKYLRDIKRKLKRETFQTNTATGNNLTVVSKEIELETNQITRVKDGKVSPDKSPVTSRLSVIKSKSPTYKIPRKSLCLRKKVFFKSAPNVSESRQTPDKNINTTALSMYMQIKEQMTFLKTPTTKPRAEILDTPARALISHNLQKQLDDLYN